MRVDFSSPQSVREALSAKDAEIERLRELLRRADGYVIWEHHPHVPTGFQEEIEAALGIGVNG
jgi:hypothetical protein